MSGIHLSDNQQKTEQPHQVVLPVSDSIRQQWYYTIETPFYGWHLMDFDISDWNVGLAPFGRLEMSRIHNGTHWNAKDIWLRKEVWIPDDIDINRLYIKQIHGGYVEIYLNGILAVKCSGTDSVYSSLPIIPRAVRSVNHGKNVVSVHCYNSNRDGFIDIGIYEDTNGIFAKPVDHDKNRKETISLSPGTPWDNKKAWQWFENQPVLKGANYIPRTAINSVEMWRSLTFDPVTIDEEFNWAAAYNYSSMRVFLNYIVWKHDPEGMLKRFEMFLKIAEKHSISIIPVFFDDCCFAMRLEPWFIEQDGIREGMYNSGWVPSPGYGISNDTAQFGELKEFVQDFVSRYRNDKRIILWDVYNEPGPFFDKTQSFALAKASMGWVRELKPIQPVTVGVFNNPASKEFMELSDIITIHYYGQPAGFIKFLEDHENLNRPVICTEWMFRTTGSTADKLLPVFMKYKIGCYHWGLVAGKIMYHPFPEVWRHHVFFPDGSVYDKEEMNLILNFDY